jgi:hypothetical protein
MSIDVMTFDEINEVSGAGRGDDAENFGTGLGMAGGAIAGFGAFTGPGEVVLAPVGGLFAITGAVVYGTGVLMNAFG